MGIGAPNSAIKVSNTANWTDRPCGAESLYRRLAIATIKPPDPSPASRFTQGKRKYAARGDFGGMNSQAMEHGAIINRLTMTIGRDPILSTSLPQKGEQSSIDAVNTQFSRPRPKKLTPKSRRQ